MSGRAAKSLCVSLSFQNLRELSICSDIDAAPESQEQFTQAHLRTRRTITFNFVPLLHRIDTRLVVVRRGLQHRRCVRTPNTKSCVEVRVFEHEPLHRKFQIDLRLRQTIALPSGARRRILRNFLVFLPRQNRIPT